MVFIAQLAAIAALRTRLRARNASWTVEILIQGKFQALPIRWRIFLEPQDAMSALAFRSHRPISSLIAKPFAALANGGTLPR